LIDAIIHLLKLNLPFVVEAKRECGTSSSWLMAVPLRALWRGRTRAFAFNGPDFRGGDAAVHSVMLADQIEALRHKFRLAGLDIASYALNRMPTEALVSLEQRYVVRREPFTTYVNDIASPFADIIAALPPDRRRLLRIAGEEALRLVVPSPTKVVALAAQAYARRGDRFPWQSRLRLLVFWAYSKYSSRIRFFGVEHNGQTQNFAVIACSARSATYLYGGSDAKCHRAAGAFLQIEIMRVLRDLDVTAYDFGGATSTDAAAIAIAKFKRNFGGRECAFTNLEVNFG